MGDNPLLMLAPAKIEEMYKDPGLVIYHDVISDREMDLVKGLATPLVGECTLSLSVPNSWCISIVSSTDYVLTVTLPL